MSTTARTTMSAATRAASSLISPVGPENSATPWLRTRPRRWSARRREGSYLEGPCEAKGGRTTVFLHRRRESGRPSRRPPARAVGVVAPGRAALSLPLLRAQRGVEGQQVAQRPRQRQHPLPYRNIGNHSIDEMRRQLGHAAAPARRTEAAPLAAERHHHVVPAAVAAHMQAAVLQQAAAQVGPKFAAHEERQTATVFARASAEERVQVRLDRAVEDGTLRLAALIGPPRTAFGHAPTGCSRGARGGPRRRTTRRGLRAFIRMVTA